jgi:type II secretory pathway component PulF
MWRHVMALIITPRQLSQRAEFYQQFGQLTSAGIPIIQALEHLSRHPPARSYRQPLEGVLDGIRQGRTLNECLRTLGNWLPEFDVALLQAGEHSGRLDSAFRLLGDYYQERAQIARQLIGDLAYPAFLFHFAVLILPFPEFFRTGNAFVYLAQTVGVLAPIYALVLIGVYAGQSRHGETWRALMESVLKLVPVLGKARHDLALARLASALEALLGAGVSILEAWDLAAAACGSPALRRTILAWRPLVDAGQTPAEVLRTSRYFPPLFASHYATGEVSGQLEQSLHGLHQIYQEQGSRKLRALAQWTPRVIYLGVVLMIAYRVVSFWVGYFNQVSAAGGF